MKSLRDLTSLENGDAPPTVLDLEPDSVLVAPAVSDSTLDSVAVGSVVSDSEPGAVAGGSTATNAGAGGQSEAIVDVAAIANSGMLRTADSAA